MIGLLIFDSSIPDSFNFGLDHFNDHSEQNGKPGFSTKVIYEQHYPGCNGLKCFLFKLHSECLRKINFVRFRDLGKGLTGVYKVKNANGTDSIVKALNTHNLECNPNLVTIRSEKNPPKNTPKLPPT